MLFPTTLVGSYPQPEWLIDRRKLAGRFPPRVRAKELWRVPEPFLAEAQDDATIMAIKAQEEAGLDIVTDGEIPRESYSNRFATADVFMYDGEFAIKVGREKLFQGLKP